MASRTKQKEEARARRLAEEQARVERSRRQRRLQMLGGVVILAIVVVVVAVIVSSGGNKTHAPVIPSSGSGRQAAITKAKKQDTPIFAMLNGIPQHGNTLGNPNAKVTVTEYGDLECSVCDAFALSTKQTTSDGSSGTGIENQLINNDVRSGKVKLVFRSLETASGSNPDPHAFLNQQTAAEAAGLQNKMWDYVELFYAQQQPEGTGYVTPSFLGGLAQQIPGLNYSQWSSHTNDTGLQAQVKNDVQTASAKGYNSTPTITVVGPKGEGTVIQGLPSSYSQIESEINQVQ
jgi:protein-disulfide isomerase